MHTALKRTTVRALFHIAENPKSQKTEITGHLLPYPDNRRKTFPYRKFRPRLPLKFCLPRWT